MIQENVLQMTLRRPDDFHHHFREGAMLNSVIEHAGLFGRVLAMPNLAKPVLTAHDAFRYRYEIQFAISQKARRPFRVLMTIQITEATTPEMIYEAHRAGVVAGKVYPLGQTTNSDAGVTSYNKLYLVFWAMQDCGMLLLLHGELPDADMYCMKRERKFLPVLRDIALTFPRLRIVMEHLSTRAAVRAVLSLPANVAGTITVHHLLYTLNDVMGDKFHPHAFCKPVAKKPRDLKALLKAATSGNPKFFFGSDSAPHLRGAKETADCCAGIYCPPDVALSLLAEIFERRGASDKLEGFTSEYGANYYGLEPNEGTMTLVKKSWKVPEEYNGVVPLYAGREISWQVQS